MASAQRQRRNRPPTGSSLSEDDPEPAIICTSCGYALSPAGEAVTKHLWEKHQVAPDLREGLMAYVRLLRLPDPSKLSLRDEGSPPHPHLVIRSGAACKHCDFMTTGLTLMIRHISKVHSGFNGGKKWTRDCIQEHVSLQSKTQNGARGYLIVDSEPIATPPADLECSPRRRARVERMLGEEVRHFDRQDYQRDATDTGIDDLAATSNWMRRTGWAETYKGVDRRLLLALQQSPAVNGHPLPLGIYDSLEIHSSSEDELKLLVLSQGIDRFFDRCENTVRYTDYSVRGWLRGQIVGRPYKAPFHLTGRTSTTSKYRAIWKCMLFFHIRMYRLQGVFRDLRAPSKSSVARTQATERLWDGCYGCTGRIDNHLAKSGFDRGDIFQFPAQQTLPPGKKCRMPAKTCEYDLDNAPVIEESSEAEYGLSIKWQTERK